MVRYAWFGIDVRPRCPLDDKVIIPSQEAAEHKAALIRVRDPLRAGTMNAYQCAEGNWHVGRSRRKRKPTNDRMEPSAVPTP